MTSTVPATSGIDTDPDLPCTSTGETGGATGWSDPDRLRVLGPDDEVTPGELIDSLVTWALTAVESLAAIDPRLLSNESFSRWATGVERIRRATDAATVAVADRADAANPFRADGFFTGKAWLKHRLHLSGPEAFRRVQVARMHRRLPVWANAQAAGIVGVAQTLLMAQVAANPLIGSDVLQHDAWELLVDAMDLPYAAFEQRVRTWESLADPDGGRAGALRNTANRDAMIRPRPDGGWNVVASLDGIGGAEFNEIFAWFVEAEWRADWDEARGRLGESTTMNDLRRTEAQRRADALLAMARAAAAAPPGRAEPLPTVNVLIDATTFEATLRGESIGTNRYRDVVCRTQRGHRLHTDDAVRTALWAHIRRVVYDASSVVIDLGRRSRLFTGSSRDAVMLLAEGCEWTGCDMPPSWCQVDHSIGWKAHGTTVPWNGRCSCGRHNRLKEQGYRTHRDTDGHWHTYGPDGVEIL